MLPGGRGLTCAGTAAVMLILGPREGQLGFLFPFLRPHLLAGQLGRAGPTSGSEPEGEADRQCPSQTPWLGAGGVWGSGGG